MFIGTNRNGSVHTCKRDGPSEVLKITCTVVLFACG